MPGVHRDGDSRFCGAVTLAQGQSSVYVNDLLVAVEGDPNSHVGGLLQAVYGTTDIYVENKLIICAMGDIAGADGLNHPAPPTDPLGHSYDVIVYGDGAGGGT